jgi:hypothetical protein
MPAIASLPASLACPSQDVLQEHRLAYRTPFRKPLHFIVITVTTVMLPISIGFFGDGTYAELS